MAIIIESCLNNYTAITGKCCMHKEDQEDKREVGSTYAGNTENELIVVIHFNKYVVI